ncbi:CHAT domain-containing protein [Kamptonema animale CS-326]|jgi:filamentous hemagglutinin family protein|uniref:CHAT domain-containing protein n=1 Tax=Kamptonema animale TaxID=92934 RepID=UPI00232DDF84|nr:CHAT domain-containing protein [Kamptonema animale]MDB9514452.1 CHAT domain-containing protein [Kamptonema animale CS-326]
MKPERHIYLLVTTFPAPNKTFKKQENGGYRLWDLGKKSSFLLPLASCLLPSLVQAQPIVPAADGTNTTVTPEGNRFNISGGQLSRDGSNLFHSFQRFGLSQGQIANFLSNDTIRNILARVTGGEASVINGLIQLTGGNSNLFLVNPAGIVFGQNAQLNVPASFTATTASGIGFGDNWFQAFGANNYSNLLGTPSAFAFPNSDPAAIVNAGNLTVEAGQNITLIGGTVISIGTLEAPGGTITLAAVSGEKIVRISQDGRLLNLEIAPLSAESGILTPDARNFMPLSLPQMLTGGSSSHATGISVNTDGQVVLTGGMPVQEGAVIVAGNIDASSSDRAPTLHMGGTVEILGDRIFLNSAKIDVSGINGGGTVKIGNGKITTNSEFLNAPEIHVSSDSEIAANGGVNGNGGDIIIGRWGGLATTDFKGQISARGGSNSGDGGTVEISGSGTFVGTVDLSATNGNTGSIQLNAENIVVAPDSTDSQQLIDSQKLIIPQTTLENITANADVVINANNDITINNLAERPINLNPNGEARSMTFVADADSNGIGSFSTSNPQSAILTNGAALSISGQNLTIGKINASGGAINLTGNDISFRGGESSISSAGGSILIAPRTAEQAIQIGGIAQNIPNTLNLENSDLAALDNGFKAITIGRLEGRGAITVNAVQVNDPLTLQSPGGTVAVQGEIIAKDDASVTINAQSTTLNANITTNNSDININSAVTLTNDVSLKTGESGGNIAISSTLNSKENAAHNLALNAGTGNITFKGAVGTGENQQLGNLSIESANNVQADAVIAAGSVQQSVGVGKTTLGEVQTTAPNGVDITTGGDIQTGNITANAGDIRLTSQTGNVTVGILNSSARVHERSGNINVNAAGHISAGSVISFGFERGGDISLTSKNGGIAVESINAGSKSGNTGSVHVKTAQYFRVLNDETKVENPGLPVHSQQAKVNSQQITDTYASIVQIEQIRSQEIGNQFAVNVKPLNGHNIQASLTTIAQQTGKKPAVIYVVSRPEQLELVLLTPNGKPVFKSIPAANSDALRRQVQKLIGGVSHRPDESSANSYLSASQQLYQWLIAPLAEELEKQKIDTLAFSLDPGMRSLPLAALHDGKQFLVQKYSLGLIPSINLTDTSYQNINNFSVLAMGASQFKDPQVVPLPAVPVELSTITQDRGGRSFLNQEFTLDNLKAQQSRGQFGIIHLATHGSFDPSMPSNSYIQMWDGKLRFEQLRELGKQRLELLVLSACETAFGSQDAELGFAGLAVQSGVKSVLASLWQVDDAGTLGLMSEFYRQLSLQGLTVKAEALRQAQIAMIEGDLRVEGGQLRSTSRGGEAVNLPSSEGQVVGNLSHPYYWASFTMIGSPW